MRIPKSNILLISLIIFFALSHTSCRKKRVEKRFDKITGQWTQALVTGDTFNITYTFFENGDLVRNYDDQHIDSGRYTISEQWYTYYCNIDGLPSYYGIPHPNGKHQILELNKEILVLQRVGVWYLDKNVEYPFFRLEFYKN